MNSYSTHILDIVKKVGLLICMVNSLTSKHVLGRNDYHVVLYDIEINSNATITNIKESLP